MKQKDVALIIVISAVSAVYSLVLSNIIFGTPTNRQQSTEIVQAINSNFVTPDKTYFNSKSLDPTQTVTIGQNANQDPFKSN